MTVQLVANEQRQVAIDIIAPTAQASTNAYAAITGGDIDARMWKSLGITIAVITNNIKWTVYGANASDFSDEQVVQVEATVAAAATGTYVTAQSVYAYYRIKIVDASGGSHGTVTMNAIQKGGV